MAKKLFFFFAFFSFLLYKPQQQSIKMGVGDNFLLQAAIQFTDLTSNFVSIIFGDGYQESRIKTSVPYVFADYRYPVSEIVSVGAQVGYTDFTRHLTYYEDTTTTEAVRYQYFVLMPGAEVRYRQRDKLKMYGNFMMGVASIKSSSSTANDSGLGFAFQLNPFGVSYGDRIAGFAEVGIGYSLFQAGIKFSF